MATSAWLTSSMRGSRAKVASPAYRGTRVASTGPTVSPVMIRGTESVMSVSILGCLRVCWAWLGGGCCLLRVRMAVLGEDRACGDDVDRLQFGLAGLDG